MGNYYLSVIKYSAGVKSTQVPVFAKQHPFISSPFYWAGFGAQRKRAQQDFKVPYKVPHFTHPPFTYERQPQHGDHPTLIRIVRGFFNVPQNYQHSRNCETGPPAYRPYPRRLESLTLCRWNYKGSTFLLSYLKTLSVGLVGVSNSRPPASQPGAQPSEPPVRGLMEEFKLFWSYLMFLDSYRALHWI